MFVYGLVAFGVISLLCAVAPTVEFLIAARALRGCRGRCRCRARWRSSPPHSRALPGKAVGTWTAWTGIATVLGPAEEKAPVEALSWRAVFWVNLPLIAVTVALTLHSVEKFRGYPDAFRGIDWSGWPLGGGARRPHFRPD